MKKYHYVYFIENLTPVDERRYYIGVRSCECFPEEDPYMGSSVSLNEVISRCGIQHFQKTILSEFSSRKDAVQHEIDLHLFYDVGRNKQFFNKARQTSTRRDTSGKVTVKDIGGKFHSVDKDDPRYLSGELVPSTTGVCVAFDENGQKHFVETGTKLDELGLKGNRKGRMSAVDSETGEFFSNISVDDPRFLSGELVGVTKDRVLVKDKEGDTFLISKDDTRWLSGELVGVTKGRVSVKDKEGNGFSVSVDDPRYLSGELVSANSGLVHVKDRNGEVLTVSTDDPRYLSGELENIQKGMISVKDHTGKVFKVKKDDPRWLSGELVGITKGRILISNNETSIYIDKKDLKEYEEKGWRRGRLKKTKN